MKAKVLKTLLLSAAAIVLVVATVLATIAYLTASSAVSNVFTVGNVAISMFEHKVNSSGQLVDANGTVITDIANGIEVDTNSYHLVPGNHYVKDPTIRILSNLQNGAEAADTMYLFVKSHNMIRTIEDANVTHQDEDNSVNPEYTSMREQMIANGWVEFIKSQNGMEIIWVYGTRAADGTITPAIVNKNMTNCAKPGDFRLCQGFSIDEKANVADYAAARVDFAAYAIQSSCVSAGTSSNVTKAIWDILKDHFTFEDGIHNPVNPYNGATGEGAYAPVPKADQTIN